MEEELVLVSDDLLCSVEDLRNITLLNVEQVRYEQEGTAIKAFAPGLFMSIKSQDHRLLLGPEMATQAEAMTTVDSYAKLINDNHKRLVTPGLTLFLKLFTQHDSLL